MADSLRSRGYLELNPISELNSPELCFTKDVAMDIGRRDSWTCQATGRKFRDGWLVDAAHFNHDKTRSYYNDKRNGRILCRTAHLEDHLRQWLGFGDPFQKKAVALLATRNWGRYDKEGNFVEGLHTRQAYRMVPELIDMDRQETLKVFTKYGLDPRDFFNLGDNSNPVNDI